MAVAKYPYLQRYAHQMMRAAMYRGDLTPPDHCEHCGVAAKDLPRALSGHHTDYSKPLEVEWLCHKCHSQIHAGERYRSSNTTDINSYHPLRDFCIRHLQQHKCDLEVPGRVLSQMYPTHDGHHISYKTWNVAKRIVRGELA